MAALLRLLGVGKLGKLLRDAGEFLQGIAMLIWVLVPEGDLEALQNYLRSFFEDHTQIVQEQPLLNQEIEALYTQFQQHMDTLYQIDALLRHVS
jgi:hypothetical protein